LPFRHRDPCRQGEKDADTRPRFMPMGNWLPEKLLPKNRAGKLAATVVSPLGTSPLLAAYSRMLGDLLLSGCKEGPNNYSYDARINGRYNGAFTYYALKALKALKADATYADWHKAIAKYLPSASYPQSPQIVGSDTRTQRQGFRLTGAPLAPQPHRGASHGTASLQDSRHPGRQLGR
jgi:hypothetical protein